MFRYIFFKSHLVTADRKGKSSVTWFGVAVVMEASTFLQLAQVEHVIKAVVTVGNDIKDHVTVVLKSIHVMIDDHCFSVVLYLNLFAGLSVYQVDQSLMNTEHSERQYTVI